MDTKKAPRRELLKDISFRIVYDSKKNRNKKISTPAITFAVALPVRFASLMAAATSITKPNMIANVSIAQI